MLTGGMKEDVVGFPLGHGAPGQCWISGRFWSFRCISHPFKYYKGQMGPASESGILLETSSKKFQVASQGDFLLPRRLKVAMSLGASSKNQIDVHAI